MRLEFTGQRLLAVVAHPDDVELLCAGTLARAKADGAAVGMCSLCRGDKGAAAEDPETLAGRRREEFVAAAALLGAETYFADVPDAQLADTPDGRGRLMRIFRQFKPTVVLAHSPEDYHPDHRAAAALAESVSWLACSPGYQTAEPPLATPPALIWMDTVNMLGFEPGFFVNITEYLPLKQQMLRRHRSQLQRADEAAFESLRVVMDRQMAARGAQAGVAAAEAFRLHLAWKRVPAF